MDDGGIVGPPDSLGACCGPSGPPPVSTLRSASGPGWTLPAAAPALSLTPSPSSTQKISPCWAQAARLQSPGPSTTPGCSLPPPPLLRHPPRQPLYAHHP